MFNYSIWNMVTDMDTDCPCAFNQTGCIEQFGKIPDIVASLTLPNADR